MPEYKQHTPGVFDVLGGRSIELYVVFKHASNELFVSRVILISPSNPGTPQNACILRGAPFGLSSPVSERASLLLKCGTFFPPFEKKFVSRTNIIERRTELTENPARAEEFGARARRPCLLNVTPALGTQIARRDLQEQAQAPAVQVWLSGALFRLRKRAVVLGDARTNANSLSAIFGCRTRKRPIR